MRRPNAQQLNRLEQKWHNANTILERVMETLKADIPALEAHFGQSDAAITYDWAMHCILNSYKTNPETAQKQTQLLCAAALTRLARASRIEDRDHVDMTPFESEVTKP